MGSCRSSSTTRRSCKSNARNARVLKSPRLLKAADRAFLPHVPDEYSAGRASASRGRHMTKSAFDRLQPVRQNLPEPFDLPAEAAEFRSIKKLLLPLFLQVGTTA